MGSLVTGLKVYLSYVHSSYFIISDVITQNLNLGLVQSLTVVVFIKSAQEEPAAGRPAHLKSWTATCWTTTVLSYCQRKWNIQASFLVRQMAPSWTPWSRMASTRRFPLQTTRVRVSIASPMSMRASKFW